MAKIDAALLVIVGVLFAVAFMNRGALSFAGTPSGTSVGIAYGVR